MDYERFFFLAHVRRRRLQRIWWRALRKTPEGRTIRIDGADHVIVLSASSRGQRIGLTYLVWRDRASCAVEVIRGSTARGQRPLPAHLAKRLEAMGADALNEFECEMPGGLLAPRHQWPRLVRRQAVAMEILSRTFAY